MRCCIYRRRTQYEETQHEEEKSALWKRSWSDGVGFFGISSLHDVMSKFSERVWPGEEGLNVRCLAFGAV